MLGTYASRRIWSHVYELINDECTLTPPPVTDKKAAWAIRTVHKRTPNTDDFCGSRYFFLLSSCSSSIFLLKPLLTKAHSDHLPTVWRPQYSTLRTSYNATPVLVRCFMKQEPQSIAQQSFKVQLKANRPKWDKTTTTSAMP
jgi:hypothetical protein